MTYVLGKCGGGECGNVLVPDILGGMPSRAVERGLFKGFKDGNGSLSMSRL